MIKRGLFFALALVLPTLAQAQQAPDPLANAALEMIDQAAAMPAATSIRLVVMFTALTVLPAVLLVMTPFTRFVIVFGLLRQAMGLQQAPPNQVLVGLSLFLALLVMRPTLQQVKTDAVDPYLSEEITTSAAFTAAMGPMRTFMLSNTRRTDIQAVLEIGHESMPETIDEIPTAAVVSAFVLSELKTAFLIAAKIYLPFLVIDIVMANVLLAMGMMMLPPVIISLPFKLLLFVLMDGWNLLVRSMAAGFAV
jgi:flagellar biosynthetic protein FliP